MSPRPAVTVDVCLDAVAKRRTRLNPWNAKGIAKFASDESFAAGVPREAQDAWAELAREARALAAASQENGGAR